MSRNNGIRDKKCGFLQSNDMNSECFLLPAHHFAVNTQQQQQQQQQQKQQQPQPQAQVKRRMYPPFPIFLQNQTVLDVST